MFFHAPFIPTPHRVVAEMLRASAPHEGDRIYDMGCGDGRIVITAALNYGIRGVGIDNNFQRIKESITNARRAGIRKKVRFLLNNLFDVNIREANIITLYLLSSLNMKLRPKLLEELRPGTRVLSHEFAMGDWSPDRCLEAEGHPVYYWIVPADVDGKWICSSRQPGEMTFELQLDQKFQKITGTLHIRHCTTPLADPVLKGDNLQFAVQLNNAGIKRLFRFTGLVYGDTIEGAMADGHHRTFCTLRRNVPAQPSLQ